LSAAREHDFLIQKSLFLDLAVRALRSNSRLAPFLGVPKLDAFWTFAVLPVVARTFTDDTVRIVQIAELSKSQRWRNAT
jgi:hypothetical protein